MVGKKIIPATDQPVCDSCQAERDGHGRDYQADLLTALPVMGVSVTDWPQVQSVLAPVDHDEVWLPYSRSYIALGRKGRAVAWVGKSYVDVAGEIRTELPGYTGVVKNGGSVKEPRRGDSCPTCHETKSLSGACACN
ncbi:hypothetical protein [Klenkia soli]|uniref:hypothetical protein n=1 Tax=Klenkia soli TaxID=1052260 RepID=UPI001042526E|nr:hypothetical protein [Klenkia soli]